MALRPKGLRAWFEPEPCLRGGDGRAQRAQSQARRLLFVMLNLFQHPGANSHEDMSFLALLLASASPANAPATPVPVVTTRSGIRLETLQPGTGPRPTRKDAVRVTYEVRLADGTLVESTAEPAGLLVSNLIPGLTEALLLMRRGGRYRVWIPARLAYGKTGNADGSVPPNSDLLFTVKLLAVGRPARPAGGR